MTKGTFTGAVREDMHGDGVAPKPRGRMASLFTMPPFSVLNAREGPWQARKRAWIKFGIKGEEGRVSNEDESGGTFGGLGESEAAKCASSASPDRYDKQKRKNHGVTYAIGDKQTWDETKRTGRPGSCYKNQDALSSIMNDKVKKAQRLAPGGGGGGCWIGGKITESTEKYHDQATCSEKYNKGAGTSVFDPVLCELMYRWFCPPKGYVLDPFAGESTKGIVASALGYDYVGCELRPEQVAANRKQAKLTNTTPTWVCGDSEQIHKLLPPDQLYDFVWTSPPYYDLEIYSASEKDGSAFETYDKFMVWYQRIFRRCVHRLQDNRFLAVKVGEVRDEQGIYRNFVGDNIRCFTELGLHYYNEIILITAVGSLPIRCGKQFNASRKIGKTHQNIQVYYKGDPKDIKKTVAKWKGYQTR